MFGDQSVHLTLQFTSLVPSKERALHVAQDPVAVADFFDYCVTCLFPHFFGWDYKN